MIEMPEVVGGLPAVETLREFVDDATMRRQVATYVASLEECSSCKRVSVCKASPYPNQVGIWFCVPCTPLTVEGGAGVLAPDVDWAGGC